MPDRPRAWAIYDTFTTKDKENVFIGIVSDTQWKLFCNAFILKNLLMIPHLLPTIKDQMPGIVLCRF